MRNSIGLQDAILPPSQVQSGPMTFLILHKEKNT